ncbi:hypothetical protein MRI28_28260, partial [Nocardiopsis dassonvillei]|uniref:hypothetical protein n=1 Tax=Nocardiopsis dassonvillei TaxID=2014 RepID=UPI00200BF958
MPEATVIVTFDVTEPHLQHCLDSLARQRDDGGTGEPRADAQVVLVPVRDGDRLRAEGAETGDESAPESTDADNGGDEDAADNTEADARGEENEQGDEAVEPAREDALALAAAFA